MILNHAFKIFEVFLPKIYILPVRSRLGITDKKIEFQTISENLELRNDFIRIRMLVIAEKTYKLNSYRIDFVEIQTKWFIVE
jgi:hypothetical protein